MGHKKIPDVGESARKERKNKAKVMTPKQIRARAKRAGGLNQVTETELKVLMRKPLEEWDLEELAKGRPKDKNGNFTGPIPHWVTRELHEKAMDRFKEMVRTDMQSHTIRAIEVLKEVMDNDETDEKGKPIVGANVKVDTAKFLIEHLIGKPTQEVKSDISIKLQAILGDSLVMPDQLSLGYLPASSHRAVEDADIVEEDEEGGSDG